MDNASYMILMHEMSLTTPKNPKMRVGESRVTEPAQMYHPRCPHHH